MKPTLDGNGRLVIRDDYRISSLNCGEEDFAIACMRSNLKYGKNQKREDVKSHHYIISFDPRDAPDNGLTVDRAQVLGEEFCKTHFPGHQALVCTHPDGHNHSGNMSAATMITATVLCWITASLAYASRVSAIPFYAAGSLPPFCRWTGNWKPPYSTGQTGNAVPSAAGIFSPSQTVENTARTAPPERSRASAEKIPPFYAFRL